MSWRVPWSDHEHVVLPLWLDSTSGCYTSELLSCAQKKTPKFLFPFSSQVQPHYHGLHFCFPFECVITSVILTCSTDRLSYIIRKGRWIIALRHSFWILQTAEAGAVSFVSAVFEWSHEISHSILSHSQSKRSHFFLQLKCSGCISVFSSDASSLMEPPLLYLVSPWRQTLNH